MVNKIKVYEIYIVNLDPTVGSEIKKTRPCLVISPDEINKSLNTIIVAPITSIERNIPTRISISSSPKSGLKENSFTALDQIKTIDKSRIIKFVGKITDEEAQEVSDVLVEMFQR